jgi:hypothetical protein
MRPLARHLLTVRTASPTTSTPSPRRNLLATQTHTKETRASAARNGLGVHASVYRLGHAHSLSTIDASARGPRVHARFRPGKRTSRDSQRGLIPLVTAGACGGSVEAPALPQGSAPSGSIRLVANGAVRSPSGERTAVTPAAARERYAPGARYPTCLACRSASIVSSTVSSTVVSSELSAPPPVIASATAAIDTLSGASQMV